MPTPVLHIAEWTKGLERHKPFYMAVIDSQTRLSFVNTHFFCAFQQEAPPENDKQFGALVHKLDIDRFDRALGDCLTEHHFVSMEIRMKGHAGRPVNWELRRLEPDGIGPVKFFCLGYDAPYKEQSAEKKPEHSSDYPGHRKLAESVIRAQQEERARIGHELHDNVNQILGSAQLYLSLLDKVGEDVGFIRDKATELVLLAIEEIRHLSHEMVMPDFRENGLVGSIQKMVEELRYARLFTVNFRHTDRLTIESQDSCLKLALYRIIQEQTRNIVKYSQAANVEISLTCTGDQVRLTISDDGKGFDPNKNRRGLGLNGICERAALLNGRARLKTAVGKGCALIVTIPVELKMLC